MKTPGHITFSVAAVWGIILAVAMILANYYAVQISINDKISNSKLAQSEVNGDVKAQISSITTRADGSEQRMDRFEAKIDAILGRLQIDPAPINQRYQIISLAPSTTTP